MMSLITLTVHLSVVAAVVVASHYYGRGYGDALGTHFRLQTCFYAHSYLSKNSYVIFQFMEFTCP